MNTWQELAVGLDIGTSSVKSELIALGKQQSVSYGNSRYSDLAATCQFFPPNIEKDQLNYLPMDEMSSDVIIKGFTESLKALEDRINIESVNTKPVSAVAACGQMHGVILWHKDTHLRKEADGSLTIHGLVSNLITWQDQRCSAEYLKTLPASASPLFTGYGCATLFWLLHQNPDELLKYDCAGTIMDFMLCMLCKLSHPVISDHNAMSWGYYDINNGDWQCDVLNQAGFPVHILPKISQVGTIIGTTKIELTGIPLNTPVYVAMGDAQCSVRSTHLSSHQAVLNMGTSCQLSLLRPVESNPVVSLPAHVQVWPYSAEHRMVVAASMNGGNALTSFVSMLRQWIHELGLHIEENVIWSKILENDNPLESSLLNSKLTITPTLLKERATPDFDGASVLGITKDNTSLRNVYKQICIGLIRNIKSLMPTEYLKSSGIADILCTGSVFSSHPYMLTAVRELFHDFNIKLISETDAALGAVYMAAKQ